MDENKGVNADTDGHDGTQVPDAKRRELVRRLAKAGMVLPAAVVIYDATTTVAHGY